MVILPTSRRGCQYSPQTFVATNLLRTGKVVTSAKRPAQGNPGGPLEFMAPRVGHTTNVSSATHAGHPEITEGESGRYEGINGQMCRSTNRAGPAGPEIWFRIIHAVVSGQNGASLATYREQEVEIALGPYGIIEDGQVGTLTRRIDAGQVVTVVPLTRGDLKKTIPRTPRVTELLRKAIEWRRQFDAGEVRNQAEIARGSESPTSGQTDPGIPSVRTIYNGGKCTGQRRRALFAGPVMFGFPDRPEMQSVLRSSL